MKWLLGFILLGNLTVMVYRLDSWPLTIYNMYAYKVPEIRLLRPAVVETNGSIGHLPNWESGRWTREKYQHALNADDLPFVNRMLQSDCRTTFSKEECLKKRLAVVQRTLIDGPELNFDHKIVHVREPKQ